MCSIPFYHNRHTSRSFIINMNRNYLFHSSYSCSCCFYFILLEILMEEKETIQTGVWCSCPAFLYPHTCTAIPQSHSCSALLGHKLCPLCPHQLLTLLHKAPTKCIRPCFPALLLPQDHTCPAVPSQNFVHPPEHFTSICLCFFLWFYCEH